jgi:hypothetical protein
MCVIPIVWFEPPLLLNYLSFYLATFLYFFLSSQRESSIYYICIARLAFSCSFQWKLQGVWELFCGILLIYIIMIQDFVFCWTVSFFLQEEEASHYSEMFDGSIASPDETTLSDMDQVSARVQLKCDVTRWRAGGEVKGKLVNGVGNQYPSHYLGTWCIQHYYRWCAHLGYQ